MAHLAMLYTVAHVLPTWLPQTQISPCTTSASEVHPRAPRTESEGRWRSYMDDPKNYTFNNSEKGLLRVSSNPHISLGRQGGGQQL